MQRFWESIFGLKRGFLNEQGELSIGFNPKWPTEPLIDAGNWNWLLAILALAGIGYFAYRMRGRVVRSRAQRWVEIGGVVALIVFVFTLLSGTVAFNVALAALAVALLLYVYPREGRATGVRVTLGVVRACLLAF